jgi:hypothetical protein
VENKNNKNCNNNITVEHRDIDPFFIPVIHAIFTKRTAMSRILDSALFSSQKINSYKLYYFPAVFNNKICTAVFKFVNRKLTEERE